MKNLLAATLLVLAAAAGKAQVLIGQMAPEISLPDTQDSIKSLHSLKGKVVMIDFWASWCGPCRASNPNVVRLYKKYKDKGFEVFGVSIDSKKSAWIKAIKRDKINYLQVNDNGGWAAETAVTYDVNAIPTTFLVDKKGVIAAVDLEGESLESKILELLQ